MKRYKSNRSNKGKSVSLSIVALVLTLLAGCASVHSADVESDLFSEVKTYNGGE